MNFSLLTKLTIAISLSIVLISGCTSDKTKNLSSKNNIEAVDFNSDKSVHNLNFKLAKTFGLDDVKSLDIHYMNFN